MIQFKSSTLLNIILVGLLIGSIVLVNATEIIVDVIPGPDEVPPAKVYDPFADVSGMELGYPDGKINMRAIGYVAGKFGTNGTSTRNVTILGWLDGIPPQQNITINCATLNATLAWQVHLGDGEVLYVSKNVAGFTRLTLVVKSSGDFGLSFGYLVGGVDFEDVHITSGPPGSEVVRRAEQILGPTIWLEIWGMPTTTVSVGLYATT